MIELDYSPHKIDEMFDIVADAVKGKLVKGRGHYYFNVPCSFDIETSSFYRNGEKQACMYIWQFGIDGKCIIGRTWDEFTKFIDDLSAYIGLSFEQRLIVYVHNLAYEFQWIQHLFKWQKVFCLDNRKPIYALTESGIEFRCSYLLSGYSLAKLGENLHTYKVHKMVGDLDYSKIRTPLTPLTDKELQYCINDVLVVMAYIQECIDSEDDITKIPLTKTGYVRRYCRKRCLNEKGGYKSRNQKYLDLMDTLQLNSVDEFKALQRAFAGGFTHANVLHSNRVCDDVSSFDFTSSYPTVMIAEKFPMSGSKHVLIDSLDTLYYYLDNYCCLFDIKIVGLEPRTINDNPLSYSKCFVRDNVQVNNGRVVRADCVATTITDVDYRIFERFYTWDKISIGDFWIYQKGYLPTELVTSILYLYQMKTTLKGVKGKEVEYMHGKSMLNAVYGMCVTNPVRDDYTYTTKWVHNETDYKSGVLDYNNDAKRFLFYPWGVWVTAYARKNLFTGIDEFGSDYIYSDTDSIKVFNKDKHNDYITRYNTTIIDKLKQACKYHGLDESEIAPKTIKGESKPLGVWDYEGTYKRFKTLGAKRYLIEHYDGSLSLTVSGLNKNTTVPFLLKTFKDNDGVFKAFQDGLYIPPDYTGKNTHTYIDNGCSGSVIDYMGVEYNYNESAVVHLEPADYNLSLATEYLKYLRGVLHYD